MARLVINEYGKLAREYRLQGDIVRIGRDPRGEVVLADPAVSRSHAQIRRGPETFILEDLGSRNGIRVNEEKLPSGSVRPLKDGDRIEVGRTVLRFIVELARKITSRVFGPTKTQTGLMMGGEGGAEPPPERLCHFRLRGLEAALLVAAKRGPAQKFALTSDIARIGRDSSADIYLLDPSISKHHAEIVFNAEGFHIVDRDSEQGTYLDGVAAHLARMETHSYLRFGKVQALFVSRRRGEEPPEASFRLRDHLLSSFPEKKEPIQEVFRACRQRPIDFVEELVARGVLEPEEWWAASRNYKKGSTGLLGNPSRWLSRLFPGRERRPRSSGADR